MWFLALWLENMFYVRSMPAQSYFVFLVLHNILYHFFHGRFTVFPVWLYWKVIYIAWIANHEYDKYFIISAWGT